MNINDIFSNSNVSKINGYKYNRDFVSIFFENNGEKFILAFSNASKHSSHYKESQFADIISNNICLAHKLGKSFENIKTAVFYGTEDAETVFNELGNTEFSISDNELIIDADKVVCANNFFDGGSNITFMITVENKKIPKPGKMKKLFNDKNSMIFVSAFNSTDAKSATNTPIMPNILSASETGYLLKRTVFNKKGTFGIFSDDISTQAGDSLMYTNYIVHMCVGTSKLLTGVDNNG